MGNTQPFFGDFQEYAFSCAARRAGMVRIQKIAIDKEKFTVNSSPA